MAAAIIVERDDFVRWVMQSPQRGGGFLAPSVRAILVNIITSVQNDIDSFVFSAGA